MSWSLSISTRWQRQRSNSLGEMKKVLILALLALLCACDGAENEYTIGQCYVVIDNSVHQDATLASAMNNMAPGTFCRVRQIMKGGAVYYDFSSNMGGSSQSVLNALDQRRSLMLGYNNGIIVGFGSMDVPAIFYAYDDECPNCFDPDMIPVRSKKLTMSSSGMAECAVCHRQYNLNTGGNIVSGDGGKKMTRYRGMTTGAFGVLSVN